MATKVAHALTTTGEIDQNRARKLFFNEAKVAGNLKHPNLVQVLDVGVEDSTWYIVMEFVPSNRTLRDHTRPDALLPIEQLVPIVFKCAKGLDYAHRSGVIHRDIKPRNILLTDDNDVKVGDFGIAPNTQLGSTDTQVIGTMGSPLYMPPEQVSEQNVTNQSDIWSLGVVLYELLTGRHPFHATNLPSIIHQITNKTHVPVHELRPSVPKILQHIVDRCLIERSLGPLP